MEQENTLAVENTVPAQNVSNVQYAGFWIRFVAMIIDGFIIGLASGIIGYVLSMLPTSSEMAAANLMKVGYGIQVLGVLTYYAAMQGGPWQATIGKKVLGLRVVRSDGTPVSYGRSIGRYFAYFVSTVTFLIGFIMAGMMPEKQALHDLIVDTRVISIE